MIEEKTCGFCKYHQKEEGTEDWICMNEDSDYCGAWTEYNFTWDEFEELE